MHNKKSQTPTEFVILLGFVLLFFIVFFVIIQGNISDKIKEKQALAVKEIALTAQNEINLALEVSDGYYREFKLPENANGQDYNITIIENIIYIKTSDNKHAMILPVINVTGNITKGMNTIKKENGEVKLNI